MFIKVLKKSESIFKSYKEKGKYIFIKVIKKSKSLSKFIDKGERFRNVIMKS